MATPKLTRGGALLAVLWLSAALSAIAFSLANTVRGEVARTSTAVDGTRAYYLAAGAVERAILYVDWGAKEPPGPGGIRRYYTPGDTFIPLPFPSGETRVEVIPETAKLNVNHASPEELVRLLLLLGVEPAPAQEIVRAIIFWRTPSTAPKPAMQLAPSFRPRQASLEETEELLLIRGITPELYYGGYNRDDQGKLIPRAGLNDCLTVFGSGELIDVGAAQPAVLGAIGLRPEVVAEIVARRRLLPFHSPDQLAGLLQAAGPGAGRLRIGGKTILTLRATARLRLPNGQLSDLRRTVAATVKFLPIGEAGPPTRILRWYDSSWTE